MVWAFGKERLDIRRVSVTEDGKQRLECARSVNRGWIWSMLHCA
jgi:hypothetical protein